MNAITLLKQDHLAVAKLFREFEAAGDGAHKHKQQIAQKAFDALELHTRLEEELFYPAIETAGKDEHGPSAEAERMVAEAREEHRVVKALISQLKGTAPGVEFDATFKVMAENVEHHVEEEESELFPLTQKLLGAAELEEIGGKMEAVKKESSKPSLMSETFQQAKDLVTRVVDSMTGDSTPKAHARRASKVHVKTARTHSKAANAGKKVVAKASKAARPVKAAAKHAVRSVVAKTKSVAKKASAVKPAARRKVARTATRRTSAAAY